MKKTLLLSILLLMVGMHTWAKNWTYAEYNPNTNVLTYYYDDRYDYFFSSGFTTIHSTIQGGLQDATIWLYNYEKENWDFEWLKDIHDVVTAIVIDASMQNIALPTMKNLFYGGGHFENTQYTDYPLSNVISITGLNNLNTSRVRSMESMFQGCSSLTSLNLSSFNAPKVYMLSDMFNGCSSLTSINLSSLNATEVSFMNGTFIRCSSLTSLVLGFNMSGVLQMRYTFAYCTSLTHLDCSSWDVSHVAEMGGLFAGCSALTNLNLSNWDVSNVYNMQLMFSDCSSLHTLDLHSFNPTSLECNYQMFANCSSLERIICNSNWSTIPSLTFSDGMFAGCTNLSTDLGATSYNATVVDKTYARPDGGSTPGYFTVMAQDLGSITANTFVPINGQRLYGTLANNTDIQVGHNYTIILDGVNINANGTYTSGNHAGIHCLGNAKIVLRGTNRVKGFYEDYPAISVPTGYTLTIEGTGSLEASSNGYGPGIGGGYNIACGNITINGGTISAQGGYYAAGIGGGSNSACGNILINGGTVTAQGGSYAPGIGTGYNGSCGTITVNNTVSLFTAIAGNNAVRSVGKANQATSCGTIKIGNTTYSTGIETSPFVYNEDIAVANSVRDKINEIGTVTYTVACQNRIREARAAFDALTEAQQQLIPRALYELTMAEAQFAAMEQNVTDAALANAVIAAINNIGTVEYTDECHQRIEAARSAYDALTSGQKTRVNNITILWQAEETYAAYARDDYQDHQAAYSVENLILAIGTVEYTQDCKARIDAARNAYDALYDEQKSLVTNLTTLEDAETTYAQLEYEAEMAPITAVINLINAIGTVEYTQDCKDRIDAARNAYDALYDQQKSLVPNLTTLEDAETTYAQLEYEAEMAPITVVINLINAIGTVEYTEEYKIQLDAAYEGYNALTEEQKGLVENKDLLFEAYETFYAWYNETGGIEQIVDGRSSKVDGQKILHEGHLFILRDGKIFNAQGARVK